MSLTGCYDNPLPFSSSLVGLSLFDSIEGVCQGKKFLIFYFLCQGFYVLKKCYSQSLRFSMCLVLLCFLRLKDEISRFWFLQKT